MHAAPFAEHNIQVEYWPENTMFLVDTLSQAHLENEPEPTQQTYMPSIWEPLFAFE